MPEERVERKLAAILAADVAGYSRLVGLANEVILRHCRWGRWRPRGRGCNQGTVVVAPCRMQQT
jgi:hypothetical protein